MSTKSKMREKLLESLDSFKESFSSRKFREFSKKKRLRKIQESSRKANR